MAEKGKAISVLTMNTLAFCVCFASWMLYGVLVTYLVDNGLFHWDKSQVGLLIGVPVLTGSVLRLPVGVLTDKFGGRVVFPLLMLLSAIAMYSVSLANTYTQFLLAGLGFGLTGASFSVGVAYTALWFPKEKQGTALGIFGAGNTGAALTSIFAPQLLLNLTQGAENPENWRMLPQFYAAALVVMTTVFLLFTSPKKVEGGQSLSQRLAPLKKIRVWRFGLYYFLVFGGFVALSQWLIPYYVNVYMLPLTLAGLMASAFSLPAGLIRSAGGWMSDQWGARSIMYMVLAGCVLFAFLLSVPRLDIESPGEGVMAAKGGVVQVVTPEKVVVDGVAYPLLPKPVAGPSGEPYWAKDKSVLVFPQSTFWQQPTVQPGETVTKKQLLARGVTHIHFQANVWIFTGLLFILGVLMGIGSAAVYKHIPDYFPDNIGVVGGIVGVLGGLGGFLCPLIFGYLLKGTGIWSTCWMFLAFVAVICLLWMHFVIQEMMHRKVPHLMLQMEEKVVPEP